MAHTSAKQKRRDFWRGRERKGLTAMYVSICVWYGRTAYRIDDRLRAGMYNAVLFVACVDDGNKTQYIFDYFCSI